MLRRGNESNHSTEISSSAELVGWRGSAVAGIDLLGDRVDVVVRAVPMESRSETGRTQHVGAATAHLPALCGAPAAAPTVDLVGVVVRRRSWRTAIRVAQGYSAFCPLLAVVPHAAVTSDVAIWEADTAGVGLVSWGNLTGPRLLLAPGAWDPPLRTEVTRVVEDIICRASAVRAWPALR